MRWTIETERKNYEFRLSLSLSHTHARAHTHTRARSLSVFLKKIIASKMCEILCKKVTNTRKKKHEKIYLCVVHAFRASNPER